MPFVTGTPRPLGIDEKTARLETAMWKMGIARLGDIGVLALA